jgi:acetyl-CoA carboxylase biotin carboxyl carrier protein
MIATLELAARRTEDGLVEILAPRPGVYRDGPARGHLVSSGMPAGTLVVLGRLHPLVAPAGVSGRVVLRADAERALAPVGYGDVLLRLDPSGVADETAAAVTETRAHEGLVLRAPMGGRFYARPSPDKPVFAEVGAVVETGATLGLLEVMKTFHRLQYRGEGLPPRAVVRERLVADGDDVERGQPVFRFELSPG